MPVEDDDDFETQAAKYFADRLNDENTEEESDEEEESEETGDETPAGDETPPPPPPDAVTLPDGRTVPIAGVEEYLRLVSFLQANPDKAEAVSQVLAGQQPPTQKLADDDEDEDEEIPEPQSRRIKELEERLARQEQHAAVQAEATTRSLINRSTAEFQQRNNLSDEDMQRVYTVAERLNVLPSFLSGVDPITGNPSDPDPLAAFDKTFTLAMNTLPDLVARVEQAANERAKKDQARKKKIGSLAGSSGSAPRTKGPVTTPEERRNAMIDEIAQAMTKGE